MTSPRQGNKSRTNAKFTEFWLDDSGGTLTDLSLYANNVGTVGLTFEEQDVTAYKDDVKNFTIGRPDAPIQVVFKNDTVVFAHLIALNHVTPLSLDVRFGIRQSPQVTGEPCFGISSSATSGYLFKDMTMTDTEITATFSVFGKTAPGYAVTNHA